MIRHYASCCVILAWLLGVTACAPVQPAPPSPTSQLPTRESATSETANLGGEPDEVSAEGELPSELKSLQEEGLQLRGDHVTFENEYDFPPTLKGQPITTTVELAVTPGPHPPMRETRESMRAMAIAHPRVKGELGERFSLLRSGWIEVGKDAPRSISTDRYEMVFYNYAENVVVTVTASSQQEVLDVQSEVPSEQPAESREEVDAAIEVVRSHGQYGDAVKGLLGRGILAENPGKDRYLYLLFYREPRTPALFEATVNMSTGTIVAARPTP